MDPYYLCEDYFEDTLLKSFERDLLIDLEENPHLDVDSLDILTCELSDREEEWYKRFQDAVKQRRAELELRIRGLGLLEGALSIAQRRSADGVKRKSLARKKMPRSPCALAAASCRR
jgi:hypothetical protein